MYYVLLSLSALVPLMDFGFGPTIGRFVAYAMGGAESLQAEGLVKSQTEKGPNYPLLWQLLFTTRTLYRMLSLGLLVLLGAWGTYMVEMRINETASPLVTRLAWAATLFAAVFDIYSNWWVIFLRNMNEVLRAARIDLLAMAVRLAIAATLLLAGAGLLSIPIGGLVGSVCQRYLARRRCLLLLGGHTPPARSPFKQHFQILWPSTWRIGLLFVSRYLGVNANTMICLWAFGLAANAQYGLSVQLLNVISGMAAVWTSVAWPVVGQYRARHEFRNIQQLLRPRIWLQTLTFLGGAAILFAVSPFFLTHFGGGKKLLPELWLGLMTLVSFFDMHLSFWTMLIFTENRFPFLWPMVASNVLSLVLSLLLTAFTPLGLGALILTRCSSDAF